MNMPQRGVDIVNSMYSKFTSLANGSEDQRRQLTRMIVQQFKFEMPVLEWGCKATSNGAPQGKDGIALRQSTGLLDIWDWQDGGTRKPILRAGPPDYPNENQYFIQVDAKNWLGETPPAEEPDDEDDDEPEHSSTLTQTINEMKGLLHAQNELLLALADRVTILSSKPGKDVVFPEYEASNRFLGTITLKPKQQK